MLYTFRNILISYDPTPNFALNMAVNLSGLMFNPDIS